jgi:hypothetical protein
MSKAIWLAGFALALLLSVHPQREVFSKYRQVEAYEVRPGVLMMPTYSDDGTVCEIGLQKLRYSRQRADVGPDLTDSEVEQVLDEIAPANERGARSSNLPGDLVAGNGQVITRTRDFENVSVNIFSPASARPRKAEGVVSLIATIRWKNRQCGAQVK